MEVLYKEHYENQGNLKIKPNKTNSTTQEQPGTTVHYNVSDGQKKMGSLLLLKKIQPPVSPPHP